MKKTILLYRKLNLILITPTRFAQAPASTSRRRGESARRVKRQITQIMVRQAHHPEQSRRETQFLVSLPRRHVGVNVIVFRNRPTVPLRRSFSEASRQVCSNLATKSLILSRIGVFILIAAAILALNFQTGYCASKSSAKNLYVYFFDVGQGDSAFIRTPNGKNILIDGGQGANEYDDFDAGKKVVIPFLIRKKITKIDYIVASHAHNDHIGGMVNVMKKYPVGVVYDSGFAYSSPIYTEFLKTIKNRKINYQIIQKGDILKWDPDLKVEVFSPKSSRLYDDPNNNSIVLKITYGKVSFLFTGDIEDEAEADLLGNYNKKDLAVEILKVPHHGSKTSSGVDFLDAVYPEIAVISCGRYNRFRHPHSNTVEKYNDFGIELHRTDKEGTIFVSTDGDTFILKSLGIEK